MASHTRTTRDDDLSVRSEAVSVRDFDLEQVRNAVRGIRFGEVRVIIQDGTIVQIERVEKQRLR